MKTYMVFFVHQKGKQTKMHWLSCLIFYTACVLQSKFEDEGKG